MSVAIALDGPAGAGKSTIAKRAAKALDYIYIDTGALYRTIGLSAMRRNIEPVESKEVSDMLSEIKVELAFNDKMEQIVLLDGERCFFTYQNSRSIYDSVKNFRNSRSKSVFA